MDSVRSLGAVQAITLCAAAAAEEISLSSLDLSKVQQGWGSAQPNKSVRQKTMRIAGRAYSTGIGTHATSRIFIELDGQAERFEAHAGVDDAASTRGSVQFEVYADGRRLFQSPTMRRGTPAKHVSIPLHGVRDLLLKVSDAGDGTFQDLANWADAKIVTTGARPRTVANTREQKYILTPKAPPHPRINSPAVYGARPGHPFLYRIPATGTRPMQFRVDNLPDGLRVDESSGIITGTTPERGEYPVQLHALNADGETSKSFVIKSGDTLSLTPYMGWNHWYAHYLEITDQKMRNAADAMIKTGMADYGYDYVCLDGGWQRRASSKDPNHLGEFRDADGNIIPNNYFPDMKGMVDYIHTRGLKAGTYTSPGPLTCSDFAGSYGFEAKDARQYAEWGFDLVKHDWCSYGRLIAGPNPSLAEMKKPYELMGDVIWQQDRDMIYNLCQYGMGNVWEWGAEVHAQSWRTAGDLGFRLDRIIDIAAENVKHRAWNGPGRWNDPDYLQIGYIGNIRKFKTSGTEKIPSPLTPTEQYSFMSLWCLMASPLVYSGYLEGIDDFALNILCNHEVIEVNQDPLGQCAAMAKLEDDNYLLVKDMADGTKAIGLCNAGETTTTLTARWPVVGIQGKYVVRDAWRQKDLGTFDNLFSIEVPRHGVALLRIRKAD